MTSHGIIMAWIPGNIETLGHGNGMVMEWHDHGMDWSWNGRVMEC